MATFTETEIGDLVDRVRSWSPATDSTDAEFTYIDLSSVDKYSKSIVSPVQTPCADAPSRARQLVAYRDVLVSTVRPNLNGAASVPAELDGATASTGFCVLRPRPDKVCWRYLYHWVRSPAFIRDMTRKATGASYPAVSDRIIHDSKIRLPKLEEQKRIAAILDKADAIRRKRQEAKSEVGELRRATFLDFFGAPALNNREWPTAPIAEVCTKVTDGTHDTPPRLADGVLLITGKNIRPFRVDLTQTDYVSPHDHQEIYRRCNPEFGDILYTNIGVKVGTAVMNPFRHEFSMKNVALLKPQYDVLMSRYLEFLLNDQQFLHKMLASSSKGGAQSFLSLTSIRQARIPVPELSLQKRFEDFANQLSETEKRCELHEQETDHLFNSLVQRAFNGEL